MTRTTISTGLLVGMTILAVLTGGCRQDQQKRKYSPPIEGTADSINPETGEVQMELIHPETGTPVKRQGFVNAETKVTINDITSRLEDLRKGDAITVSGYHEGPRETRKFIVTSINVKRATNDWLDTDGGAGAPASRAAGGIQSSGATREAPAASGN